ncbi:FixH family protein [Pontibacter sp. JAM-7]|uniref:FixH family protein n=1 Tax=Pontibacter sp. JAM-7 TaxID=3366581 RepID=UPI003AF72408
MNEQTPPAPWYKQPWLWFILAPLIAVFIYGTTFLYLSIVTMDGVVKDDYYKVARNHLLDPSRIEAAHTMGISGDLLLDNMTGDLMLHFKTNQDTPPDTLQLSIVHPTHQKYDQSITLRRVPSSMAYTGSLQAALKGKRYLVLEPESQLWRLRAEVLPPYDQNTIELRADN